MHTDHVAICGLWPTPCERFVTFSAWFVRLWLCWSQSACMGNYRRLGGMHVCTPTYLPVERHTFPRRPKGLVAGICGAIPAGLSVDGIAAGSNLLRPFESNYFRMLPADMQLYLPALSTPCVGRAQLLFLPQAFLTGSCISFAPPPRVSVCSACLFQQKAREHSLVPCPDKA